MAIIQSSGANGINEFYMDNMLKANLDAFFDLVKKDHDFVCVVDGSEGGGKSTVAQQCAWYFASKAGTPFKITNIIFRGKEFEEKLRNANHFEAFILDEAYLSLNSKQAMSSINRTINSMLTEIRQKNLFIFIVLPSFFDLDKYIALWRARALIHVKMENKEGTLRRGRFNFYSAKVKKSLYIKGKKFYNYNCEKPNFMGRFVKALPVDEAEYRKAKLQATSRSSMEDEASLKPLHQKWLNQRNIAWWILKNKFQYSAGRLAKDYGCIKESDITQSNISAGIRDAKEILERSKILKNEKSQIASCGLGYINIRNDSGAKRSIKPLVNGEPI